MKLSNNATNASRILLLGLLAVSASMGCDSSTTDPDLPETASESELTFVQFTAESLALADREVSLWAVRGEDREVRLSYAPDSAGAEPERFLKFRVREETLLTHPNGSAVAPGDSVLITIRVDDAGRFLFDFQPSGLGFNPDEPAELEVSYLRANPDLNGDGVVDGLDAALEANLSLWKQEGPGDPFEKIGTLKFEELDEVEAEITSFTGFALAS